MGFFDQTGNAISYGQWLGTYGPPYFLGGSPLGRKVDCRNQSSHWIENQIDGLLAQPMPPSQADLTLAVAWKIGAIDHPASTSSVGWKPASFPTALIGGQYRRLNFSQSIPYLAANMVTIMSTLKSNPAYLLDSFKWPKGFGPTGFGPTHKLAIQFFITHGREPIYDKFAHKAALAIDQNLKPCLGSTVTGYRPVQTWSDYQTFKSLLRRIGLQPHGSMFISRDDDRALWVYGHLFK